MTDRELLELAAKAAGVAIFGIDEKYGAYIERACQSGPSYWNPLTNRLDAFSLMVKLGMDVSVCRMTSRVLVTAERHIGDGSDSVGCQEEGQADQADQLTMRSITRCAAEVGRAMG